jgi:hypothetical protein
MERMIEAGWASLPPAKPQKAPTRATMVAKASRGRTRRRSGSAESACADGPGTR